jgi:hypothetical protein
MLMSKALLEITRLGYYIFPRANTIGYLVKVSLTKKGFYNTDASIKIFITSLGK